MLLIQIVLAAISVLGGYGAFVCFLVMRNFQACIWALATGNSNLEICRFNFLNETNFQELLLVFYYKSIG